MAWHLNVFTGTFDITLSHTNLNSMLDGDYLKIDQTTYQTVINGLPQFNEGIVITSGKRLYLDG